jgi:NTP pyrophosphatase (non-canonical NTP hydrolase)
MSEIKDMQNLISDFAKRRNWEEFHTPKNLVMAITGEAGELASEFQWLTQEEAMHIDGLKLKAVSHEVADVAIYLFRLCHVLGIDLQTAVKEKLNINESRFPEVR